MKISPTTTNLLSVLTHSNETQELALILLTNKRKENLFYAFNHDDAIKKVEQIGLSESFFTDLNAKIRIIIGDIGLISFQIQVKYIDKLHEMLSDDIKIEQIISIDVANDSFENLNISREIILGQFASLADGTGKRIGIIDSGVDEKHPDLNVFAQFDLTEDQKIASERNVDRNGHGTHVAGIAAGKGTKEQQFTGIAPNAEIVAAKIFSNLESDTLTDQVIAGIYKCAKEYQVDVVNLSIGKEPMRYSNDEYTPDTYELAFQRLREMFPDTVLVCSAGNMGYTSYGSISVPGEFDSVITVGSVDKEKKISYFSSTGPTRDGRVKPDIVAVGGYGAQQPNHLNIISSKSRKSVLNNLDEDLVKDIDNCELYTSMSGTSMAAPQVSGIALLLCKELDKESYKSLKGKLDRHTLIKSLIMATATNLGEKEVIQGAGLVSFERAKKLLETGEQIQEIKTEAIPITESITKIGSKIHVQTQFHPYKESIKGEEDNLLFIAEGLQAIQTKYILRSIGKVGALVLQAAVKNPSEETLATFRFYISFQRVHDELVVLMNIETKYAVEYQDNEMLKTIENVKEKISQTILKKIDYALE